MNKRPCSEKPFFNIRRYTGEGKIVTLGNSVIMIRKIKRENSISFSFEICKVKHLEGGQDLATFKF